MFRSSDPSSSAGHSTCPFAGFLNYSHWKWMTCLSKAYTVVKFPWADWEGRCESWSSIDRKLIMIHVGAQHTQFESYQSHKRRAFGFDAPLVMKRRRVQSDDDRMTEKCMSDPSTFSMPSVSHDRPSQSYSVSLTAASQTKIKLCKTVGFGGLPARSCSSGAKSSPKSSPHSDVPWWLQPQTPAYQQVNAGSCYYCCGPRRTTDHISCQRCEHDICEMCTRICDTCTATWCPYCTIVDYESPVEQTVCFDCYEDARTRRQGVGCSDSSSSGFGSILESDEDNIMLSWD